jgi:multiple sugar transport system substrate-binding protein
VKTIRIVAALAVAALVPIGLAACSPTTKAAPSASHLDLTVEDYFQAPQVDVYNKIYATCAAAEGDTVTATHVPGASLISKVLQQSSSKTLPDVLMLDNPDVQQIASSGALSPLKNYGITGKGVSPGVLSAGTYKGDLYGLAPAVNSLALFYNKDILSAAGITPPKTWAELTTDAKALTTPDHYGFAFSGINTYEGTWQFMPWMWSNGGSEKNINTSQTAGALALLTDLVKAGSASASVDSWAQSDVDNQFIAGKAAMMENGPWQIPSLTAVSSLHWGYVPLPTRTADQTSQAPLGGETFNVTNTGDKAKQAAAGKLVACINNAKNAGAIATANLYIPSNEAAAAAFGKANPDLAGFAKIIADARARTALLGADWPTAATKIYTAEQLSLTGKAAPDAALAQAQSGN